MGFFKNLFEKKTCDICGGEIGLLGNRKLEDGNCCKDCAKKLSPWFTDRKSSTIAEIKEQLESREANKASVAAFDTTRTYGKYMKVYIDETARKFMVTDEKDLEKANPDVLDFSQVTGCDLDIRESKHEVYRKVRDSEGNTRNESYSPRRYHWSYDFIMNITVNHPYIEEIQFDLSGGYFRVESSGGFSLFGSWSDDSNAEGSIDPPGRADREANHDYMRYEQWAREIRQILLSKAPETERKPVGFEELMEELEAAAQAEEHARASGDGDAAFQAAGRKAEVMKHLAEIGNELTPEQKNRASEMINRYLTMPAAGQKKVCPYCGAESSGGKFCENCGAKLE